MNCRAFSSAFLRLAFLLLSGINVISSFRICSSQMIASKSLRASSCMAMPARLPLAQQRTKTALKMAIDLGTANDLILAAANTVASSSETPRILNAFNSAEVQSLLKELKSVSANTPLPEIQAYASKLANSPEVRHLFQDIQGLENKVNFSLVGSTLIQNTISFAASICLGAERCGRCFHRRLILLRNRVCKAAREQRCNNSPRLKLC